MQFNAFFYILALVAIVHGAAISIRAGPSWANIASLKPGNPPSANAPVSGQASTTPRPVPVFQPGGCNCAGVEYSPTLVSQTLQRANILPDEAIPNTYGDRKYPHLYGNSDRITKFNSLCAGNQLREFPLTKPDLYYGGPPGADRIVFMRDTGMFCGCMRHITPTEFDACSF